MEQKKKYKQADREIEDLVEKHPKLRTALEAPFGSLRTATGDIPISLADLTTLLASVRAAINAGRDHMVQFPSEKNDVLTSWSFTSLLELEPKLCIAMGGIKSEVSDLTPSENVKTDDPADKKWEV